MDIKVVIGSNIQRVRKQKNIKQEELAKLLKVSQSYLSDLETGDKNIKIDFLQTCSEKLGVSVSYLVTQHVYSDKEIKEALDFALKEYDEETVFNIMENDFEGWRYETEILNHVDVATAKRVLNS